MSTQIEVDQDVWEELKTRAEPFVDTPNTVIRSLLGLESNGHHAGTPAPSGNAEPRPTRRKKGGKGRRSRGTRAPAGSLLAESEYELPILQILTEMGGRGPTSEIVEKVGAVVEDKLKELDKEVLASGEIRWRNRVQFTRLRMIEEGWLAKDSPRGTWEITAAGSRRFEDEES